VTGGGDDDDDDDNDDDDDDDDDVDEHHLITIETMIKAVVPTNLITSIMMQTLLI
jgi:hypothetical protein